MNFNTLRTICIVGSLFFAIFIPLIKFDTHFFKEFFKSKRPLILITSIISALFALGIVYFTIKANELKSAEDKKIQTYKLDQISRQVTDLNERLGYKIDPKSLLRKYPLGYIIFELGYTNTVLPYENKLLNECIIDWKEAKITLNTDTRIELQIPDIKDKNGKLVLSQIRTGGPKQVGNLGGVMVGDYNIWGEILEINNSSIVFLIGFDINQITKSDRLGEIATNASIEFHTLYNLGNIDQIWNDLDPQVRIELKRENFENSINSYLIQLGKYESSSDSSFSVDLRSIPNLVTIRQLSKFHKKSVSETFIYSFDKDYPALKSWKTTN